MNIKKLWCEYEARALEKSLRILEDQTFLAEGRLRLIARKLETPVLADYMQELEQALNNISKEEISLYTIKTAKKLILAMQKLSGTNETPDISIVSIAADINAIAIRWREGELELDWLVYSTTTAWPTINVRAYITEPYKIVPMYKKTFRLANSLLEFSKKYAAHRLEE